MPPTLLKRATVYPHKHRSGRSTWVVNVGRKINGKADLHRFKTETDAKNFQTEWNLKLVEKNTEALADLQGVARHEVLAALGKLKVVGATLNEAVDFFLKFGRPPRPGVSIKEAIDAFLEAKRKKKRSEKYQRTIEHTTLLPFSRAVIRHCLLTIPTGKMGKPYRDFHFFQGSLESKHTVSGMSRSLLRPIAP